MTTLVGSSQVLLSLFYWASPPPLPGRADDVLVDSKKENLLLNDAGERDRVDFRVLSRELPLDFPVATRRPDILFRHGRPVPMGLLLPPSSCVILLFLPQ
jgi:hypothetical protein